MTQQRYLQGTTGNYLSDVLLSDCGDVYVRERRSDETNGSDTSRLPFASACRFRELEVRVVRAQVCLRNLVRSRPASMKAAPFMPFMRLCSPRVRVRSEATDEVDNHRTLSHGMYLGSTFHGRQSTS
jgi:hypothetical protein